MSLSNIPFLALHARYECLRVKRPTRRGDNTNSLPQIYTVSFYAHKKMPGDNHAHSSSLPRLCGDDEKPCDQV